jgi:hypothetical protein
LAVLLAVMVCSLGPQLLCGSINAAGAAAAATAGAAAATTAGAAAATTAAATADKGATTATTTAGAAGAAKGATQEACHQRYWIFNTVWPPLAARISSTKM